MERMNEGDEEDEILEPLRVPRDKEGMQEEVVHEAVEHEEEIETGIMSEMEEQEKRLCGHEN